MEDKSHSITLRSEISFLSSVFQPLSTRLLNEVNCEIVNMPSDDRRSEESS